MLIVRISWEFLSVYVKSDIKEMVIIVFVRIFIFNLYFIYYENDYLIDIYMILCNRIFIYIVLYICKLLYYCYYKIGICL